MPRLQKLQVLPTLRKGGRDLRDLQEVKLVFCAGIYMSKRSLLAAVALLLVGAVVVALVTPTGHRIWWPFLLLLAIPLMIIAARRSRR